MPSGSYCRGCQMPARVRPRRGVSGGSEPVKNSEPTGDRSRWRAPTGSVWRAGGARPRLQAGKAALVVRLELSAGRGGGSRDVGEGTDLEGVLGLGS